MAVARGEAVTILEKREAGWWRVRKADGQEGFVAGSFFAEMMNAPPGAGTALSYELIRSSNLPPSDFLHCSPSSARLCAAGVSCPATERGLCGTVA